MPFTHHFPIGFLPKNLQARTFEAPTQRCGRSRWRSPRWRHRGAAGPRSHARNDGRWKAPAPGTEKFGCRNSERPDKARDPILVKWSNWFHEWLIYIYMHREREREKKMIDVNILILYDLSLSLSETFKTWCTYVIWCPFVATCAAYIYI